MEQRSIHASDAPKAVGGYSQAVEISGYERLLFISGQVPESAEGSAPNDFRSQCDLVWRNIEAQLRSAGMSLDNLIKVTTFLPDRQHRVANREVRQQVLGDRSPALTVIIADLFDETWLIEIEAIAAA